VNKRWRRVLFTAGLTLGLALLLWQVWRSYEAVQRYGFRLFCPACLGAALALSLLVQLVAMLAWIQVMRHLGYYLPLGRALAGYMLSFLPRYIPGSVWGYLGRSEWLAESYNISYAVSMTGSLLEALALIATGLCIAGLAVIKHATGALSLLSAAGLAVLLWFPVRLLPQFTLRLVRWIAPKLKSGARWEPLRSQPAPARASRSWFKAILLYLVFWAIYGGVILLIARAVMPFPVGRWFEAAFSISLSWIAGFVALFVPAGVGVRELALANLLSRSSGIFLWQGILIAVISRLIAILAELIWVAIGVLLYAGQRRNPRRRDRESTGPAE
jgi:glycosyltransferase 2 family protein